MKTLITTTPDFQGRSYGTNVVEAALLALLGKKWEDVTPADYERVLARTASASPSDRTALTRRLPRVLRFFDISVLASASMGPAYSLASTMGPMVFAAGYGAPLALVALSRDHAVHRRCLRVSFARGAERRLVVFLDSHGVSARTPARTARGCCCFRISLRRWRRQCPAGIYTLALVVPAHVQDPLWTAGVGAVWILASAALLYAGVRPTALVTFVALALELGVLLVAAVAASLHAPVPAHA